MAYPKAKKVVSLKSVQDSQGVLTMGIHLSTNPHKWNSVSPKVAQTSISGSGDSIKSSIS